MSFILVYEPRRGLIYFLQKCKGEWQWNGLKENAYEFKNIVEATNAKRHLLLSVQEVAEIKEIKEASQEKEA